MCVHTCTMVLKPLLLSRESKPPWCPCTDELSRRPVKLLKSETLIITTGTETKTPRVYILMPKWVQEAWASCRHQQNEHDLTPKQETSLE